MKKIAVVLVMLGLFMPWISSTHTVQESRPVVIPYTVREQVPAFTYTEKALVIDDGGLAQFKAGVYFTGEEYMAAYRSIKPERWGVVGQYTPTTRTREETRYRITWQLTSVSRSRLVSPVQLLLSTGR